MKLSYRKSSVLKHCGSWVVTKFGVECSTRYSYIPRRDLQDDALLESWRKTDWVNAGDLDNAIKHHRLLFDID